MRRRLAGGESSSNQSAGGTNGFRPREDTHSGKKRWELSKGHRIILSFLPLILAAAITLSAPLKYADARARHAASHPTEPSDTLEPEPQHSIPLADRFDRKHLFIQERLVNGTTGRGLELRMSPERGGAVGLSIYESVHRASNKARFLAWFNKLPFPLVMGFFFGIQIFARVIASLVVKLVLLLIALLVVLPVVKFVRILIILKDQLQKLRSSAMQRSPSLKKLSRYLSWLAQFLTEVIILKDQLQKLRSSAMQRSPRNRIAESQTGTGRSVIDLKKLSRYLSWLAQFLPSRLQKHKRCSTTWIVSKNGVVNCHGSAFGEPGCR